MWGLQCTVTLHPCTEQPSKAVKSKSKSKSCSPKDEPFPVWTKLLNCQLPSQNTLILIRKIKHFDFNEPFFITLDAFFGQTQVKLATLIIAALDPGVLSWSSYSMVRRYSYFYVQWDLVYTAVPHTDVVYRYAHKKNKNPDQSSLFMSASLQIAAVRF